MNVHLKAGPLGVGVGIGEHIGGAAAAGRGEGLPEQLHVVRRVREGVQQVAVPAGMVRARVCEGGAAGCHVCREADGLPAPRRASHCDKDSVVGRLLSSGADGQTPSGSLGQHCSRNPGGARPCRTCFPQAARRQRSRRPQAPWQPAWRRRASASRSANSARSSPAAGAPGFPAVAFGPRRQHRPRCCRSARCHCCCCCRCCCAAPASTENAEIDVRNMG